MVNKCHRCETDPVLYDRLTRNKITSYIRLRNPLPIGIKIMYAGASATPGKGGGLVAGCRYRQHANLDDRKCQTQIICRMEGNRLVKEVMLATIDGEPRRGRTRHEWLDDIKE